MGAPELWVLEGREVQSLPSDPELRVVARILIDQLESDAHHERLANAYGAQQAAYGWRCRQAALRRILDRIQALVPDHKRGPGDG